MEYVIRYLFTLDPLSLLFCFIFLVYFYFKLRRPCSSVETQSKFLDLAKRHKSGLGGGGVEIGKICESFAQAHMS